MHSLSDNVPPKINSTTTKNNKCAGGSTCFISKRQNSTIRNVNLHPFSLGGAFLRRALPSLRLAPSPSRLPQTTLAPINTLPHTRAEATTAAAETSVQASSCRKKRASRNNTKRATQTYPPTTASSTKSFVADKKRRGTRNLILFFVSTKPRESATLLSAD